MGNSWKQTTLGEVVNLKRGFDLPSSERKPGTIPIISSSGISGTHSSAMRKAPGVVTGRYGTIGKVFYISEDYWPLNTTLYVEDFKGNHPRFIHYFLHTIDFLSCSDKAAVPGVNRNHLHMASVLIPPIPTQKAIAHILGTIDDKIELLRSMNETLEAMARALFKSWFIDFDPVRKKAEGQPTGLPPEIDALFPDSFEDSELGEIPKGWQIEALGKCINIIKGRSYKSEELAESSVALVTLKSFARGGGYRIDGLKPYTGSYNPEQEVFAGEIVVACTDVTQAAEVIGRPAIVRSSSYFHHLVASLDTLIVRPETSKLTKAFFYYLGGTDSFVSHTYSYTSGTTVLHLSKEALPSFKFVLPSLLAVKSFDSIARKTIELVDKNGSEIEQLQKMRDSLLPRLISGEIELSDKDISKIMEPTK